MIIGVDAGALSITDDRLKVGVYRVVLNLLKELGKQDKKNIYRLYSFQRLNVETMRSLGRRMVNVVLPKKGWFRVWVPLELRRNPVDVFLGLSQALPSFSNYSLGFVYDVGFLHFPHTYPGSYLRLKNQTEDLIKRSKQIVTISHTTALDLVTYYGVDKHKLTVSYPGVSHEFTAFGSHHKISRPYVLFVGALKLGKNIPILLEAFFHFIKTRTEKYDLLLVGGDYWLDPAIEETIQRFSLQSHVKRTGIVSDSKLASLYRSATALVVTSLWEGFCLPVAEAMASGCPIIVSKAGALPEIVGDSGIVVLPNDIPGYVKAMTVLTTDKDFRNTLIQKGKIRAHIFSWATMATDVLKLIHHEDYGPNV